MVVLVVDVDCVLPLETERYSPVPGDTDGPSAPSFSLQFMEVQTREVHILGFDGRMQPAEDETKTAYVIGANSGLGSFYEEAPQPLVLEAPDHNDSL